MSRCYPTGSSEHDKTITKSERDAGDDGDDVDSRGQRRPTEGSDFLALGLLPAPQSASRSFGKQAKTQVLTSGQSSQNLVAVGVVDLLPEKGRLRNSTGPKLQSEVADVLVGVDVPAQVDFVTFSAESNDRNSSSCC